MTSKKNGHKDHSGRAATGGAGTTPAVTTEPLDVDGKPESAVVKAIQNRIRNLTKRLRKIEAIEAKGVTLSKEQEDLLASKACIVAAIEELTKLIPTLQEAVNSDIAATEQRVREETLKAGEDAGVQGEDAPNGVVHTSSGDADPANEKAVIDAVRSVVMLCYFAKLFRLDSKSEDYNKAERSACLSYDEGTEGDPERLTEEKLEAIQSFGDKLMTRPPQEYISHSIAIENCVNLALQWVKRTKDEIAQIERSQTEDAGAKNDLAVADVVPIFNRILGLQYLNVQPQEMEVQPEAHEHAVSLAPPTLPFPLQAPLGGTAAADALPPHNISLSVGQLFGQVGAVDRGVDAAVLEPQLVAGSYPNAVPAYSAAYQPVSHADPPINPSVIPPAAIYEAGPAAPIGEPVPEQSDAAQAGFAQPRNPQQNGHGGGRFDGERRGGRRGRGGGYGHGNRGDYGRRGGRPRGDFGGYRGGGRGSRGRGPVHQEYQAVASS